MSAGASTDSYGEAQRAFDQVRWAGVEQALRNQLIAEGAEPVWLEEERKAREAAAAVRIKPPTRVPHEDAEQATSFSRTFTEDALGLALNEGGRGAGVVVKRILPGSAAAGRRIPQGGVASVVAVNGTPTDGLSLKQVQKLIKTSERPVTIAFTQQELRPPPEPPEPSPPPGAGGSSSVKGESGGAEPKGKWNPTTQRFEEEKVIYRAGVDF